MKTETKPAPTSPFLRKLGIGILGILTLGSLISIITMVPLAEQISPGSYTFPLAFVVWGFAFGFMGLIVNWCVLGEDHWTRRLTLFSFAAAAFALCWFLGFLFEMDTAQSLRTNKIWMAAVMGMVAPLVLGLALVPYAVQLFFRSRIAKPEHAPLLNSTQFSIAQMMILTALIAIIGGCVEMTQNALSSSIAERWMIAGIGLAETTTISLISIVPLTILLLRKYLGIVSWAMVLVVITLVTAFTIYVHELISSRGRSSIPDRFSDESVCIGILVLSGLAAFSLGTFALRALGYRLVRAGTSPPKPL